MMFLRSGIQVYGAGLRIISGRRTDRAVSCVRSQEVLCEALIRGGGWSGSVGRYRTSHRPFQSDWQARSIIFMSRTSKMGAAA